MNPEKLEQVMAKWWNEHVHNSPISRATDAYNHLVAKFEVLKAELKAEFAPPAKTKASALSD